jgi:hypothetical protein
MAPEPDTSDINTDSSFLRDPRSGDPVLGEGVKANLSDLTGYSANMNEIQLNFGHLSGSMMNTLRDMITGAFGNMGNGLEWTRYMMQLSQHNAGELDKFYRGVQTGVLNVASAAQVVANVYAETDATNAATLEAVLFAFGDKSKAPDSVPQELLNQLKTYEQAMAEQAASAPPSEAPANATDTSTPGTTITTLPGGHTLKTVVTSYVPYQGGPTIITKTVYYDGRVQTVTSTTMGGGPTTTRTTTSYYDENGNHLNDRVTREPREDVSVNGGAVQTTTTTTNYEYDPQGNEMVDESSTASTVAVGPEGLHQPLIRPEDDPAFQEQQRLREG